MGLCSEYGLLPLVVVYNVSVELPRHWLNQRNAKQQYFCINLEWLTSTIHMNHTAGRRLERKFASLRRKEWERKCCNLNCVDSCWDIPDSPRCCLQLVSNLERKWKCEENNIKMAIASATYNCQFSPHLGLKQWAQVVNSATSNLEDLQFLWLDNIRSNTEQHVNVSCSLRYFKMP